MEQQIRNTMADNHTNRTDAMVKHGNEGTTKAKLQNKGRTAEALRCTAMSIKGKPIDAQ